jgi:ribulose-phosphate 3-epimerase
MSPIQIAPSILAADFARLGAEVKACEDGGADIIHFDVMDGQFVPNITIGPLLVGAVKRSTRLPIDCHLMIVDPDRYIPEFVKEGAQMISVHPESGPHLHRTLGLIRSLGAKAGVVLNPATPVQVLDYVVGDLDFVLVMSVNPGFGGQAFIPSALDKVRAVKALLAAHGRPEVPIEIDGGIKANNAGEAAKAGATMLVAGSAIFGSKNYAETITAIRGNAEKALSI